MTGNSYIQRIVDNLKSTNPEKIILFGSYAYGTPSKDSDIDILVVTNDAILPSSFSEKNKIYLRVSKSISDIKKEFPVDLIVHTKSMHKKFIETNSMFARELIKKGKILYEKITKDWFESAKSDLMLVREIIGQEYLAHLSAFHSQQAIEKSFKGIIEEFELGFIKTYSLETLYHKTQDKFKYPIKIESLIILDQLYIDARYPGELGLLPHGKPTKNEAESFLSLANQIFTAAQVICRK